MGRSIQSFNIPARANHGHLTVIRAQGMGNLNLALVELEPELSGLSSVIFLCLSVEVFKGKMFTFTSRWLRSKKGL